MTTLAFNDDKDGYYQVEVAEGQEPPEWTRALTPCSVQPASFDIVKASVWNRIKTERDRRRFEGGIFVSGHWFLSTPVAAAEYSTIVNLELPEETILRTNWRTMDGAEVPMSPALARQIIVAGFSRDAAIDDAATAHKMDMEASQDPSAYNFSNGWPQTFEEWHKAKQD